MTDALTDKELEALSITAELVGLYAEIVGNGPSRENDMQEFVGWVHCIQHAIMSQAAARAFPQRFRLLGETLNSINTLDFEYPVNGKAHYGRRQLRPIQ